MALTKLETWQKEKSQSIEKCFFLIDCNSFKKLHTDGADFYVNCEV